MKARINAKLAVYQAVTKLKVKSLESLDSDGKPSKKLWLETLVLFTEASEACLFCVWRKLKMCEELFSSLLAGMTQIAVTKGGQQLRVLLIRLKGLVLTACAQVVRGTELCLSSVKMATVSIIHSLTAFSFY